MSPRRQSSVHVAHGRGLRLNAEAPAIFVIDDDETIGAADWDYPAKQDINGTTAEIRCAPLRKPILNSFRVITPSRTVNIPAKRIRTPSKRVIASQFAAALDCSQRNRWSQAWGQLAICMA